ncbi:chromatin structure-remodeling complex protein BSH-like, partial [Hibiscus syriacus]|uniref:chromatin structure-remodeling complex protein BSH-like n=1 Tax=Hibiscus syriacus TaxID=106335 RepID=UPI001922693B
SSGLIKYSSTLFHSIFLPSKHFLCIQYLYSLQHAIALAIREQLYEIAIQNVASARENRINKKGRRAAEHFPISKASGAALDLMKLFSFRSSVIRKRKEWDNYKPVLDVLSNEDVDALEAKKERSGR